MVPNRDVTAFTAAGNAHLTCNQDEHATGNISFMHQYLPSTTFNSLGALADPL
jgi:acetyl-CoA carboxylase carboxyltransferase component